MVAGSGAVDRRLEGAGAGTRGGHNPSKYRKKGLSPGRRPLPKYGIALYFLCVGVCTIVFDNTQLVISKIDIWIFHTFE